MEELIVVGFHDSRRAAQAFNLLWQMNEQLVIELNDAVIVHRDQHGNLEYDQDFASTQDRRVIQAGFWGCLLGALVAEFLAVGGSAIPASAALCVCVTAGGLIGVVAGALKAAEAAASWKDHCVPKSLVSEVVADLRPGDSAVVAWADSAGLEMASPAFRGLGGNVLRTTLPRESTARFESVLRA